MLAGTVAVYAWTGPTAAPPNNNTPAPINVSGTAQTKAGNLTVNNLIASDGITLGGVKRTTWPAGGGAPSIVATTAYGNTVSCGETLCQSVAACPSGYTVTGGGYYVSTPVDTKVGGCGPERRTTYHSAHFGNAWVAKVSCSTFAAYALCVKIQ